MEFLSQANIHRVQAICNNDTSVPMYMAEFNTRWRAQGKPTEVDYMNSAFYTEHQERLRAQQAKANFVNHTFPNSGFDPLLTPGPGPLPPILGPENGLPSFMPQPRKLPWMGPARPSTLSDNLDPEELINGPKF